jgi:hypothetical protein
LSTPSASGSISTYHTQSFSGVPTKSSLSRGASSGFRTSYSLTGIESLAVHSLAASWRVNANAWRRITFLSDLFLSRVIRCCLFRNRVIFNGLYFTHHAGCFQFI